MGTPGEAVGARIRQYRRKQGRTQVAVAGLVGVTERYLSLIENEQRTPSPAVLARLADELSVPISSLLSDDVPRKETIVGLSTLGCLAGAGSA